MKTLKSLLMSLPILFVFSSIDAQTYNEPENINNSYENLLSKDGGLNLLSTQRVKASSTPLASSSNSVFIEQVGSDNVFNSNTDSESTNVNIVQQGNENIINLDLTAKEIEQTVLQNGSRNSYFNIANNPLSTQKNQVLQNGINQDITLYGGNSLSESMQINMQGSDRSIIIRNFN